jgi:KaiC/GvpD/RAD55 family RecA-like ATPase
MPQLNLPELLSAVKFNPDAHIEPDKIYFAIGEAIIGTAGNFVTLSGLPKAGKSTFISAIVASFVANKEVFSFRSFNYEYSRKIALFDTEQTNFDFSRTITRIKKLAKKADIFQNLDCFLMREQSAFEILHLINYYLKQNDGKVGIVVIDGILDCLNSFNDETESKKLIRILKRWASKYGCLIVTVLHTGKQSGQTLGHYGSMSDRYSQSTLNIEKSKQGSFVCAPKLLRSAGDFLPVEIVYNEKLNNYEQI